MCRNEPLLIIPIEELKLSCVVGNDAEKTELLMIPIASMIQAKKVFLKSKQSKSI